MTRKLTDQEAGLLIAALEDFSTELDPDTADRCHALAEAIASHDLTLTDSPVRAG